MQRYDQGSSMAVYAMYAFFYGYFLQFDVDCTETKMYKACGCDQDAMSSNVKVGCQQLTQSKTRTGQMNSAALEACI